METKTFKAPQPIKAELIQELDSLVGDLRNLSIRRPSPFEVQEAAMDARLADFLELAEQDYIKGWTDQEEGVRHREGLSEAYNAGYGDSYEYENRSDGYGEDMG
jgi:hypothetical protein